MINAVSRVVLMGGQKKEGGESGFFFSLSLFSSLICLHVHAVSAEGGKECLAASICNVIMKLSYCIVTGFWLYSCHGGLISTDLICYACKTSKLLLKKQCFKRSISHIKFVIQLVHVALFD